MRNAVFFILLFLLLGNCATNKLGQVDSPKEAVKFQRKLNKQYGSVKKSPLKAEDLAVFKGLDFFEVDLAYRVEATFKRTPNEKAFEMKTTTDRLPVYVKYGEVHFKIKGEDFQLNIYQNQALVKKKGYEDYLFIPFTDLTNGEQTYAGGRYIDLRIPKGDKVIIDFNKAYNPYCVYNYKYSCPIPPGDNHLETPILAGVKKGLL